MCVHIGHSFRYIYIIHIQKYKYIDCVEYEKLCVGKCGLLVEIYTRRKVQNVRFFSSNLLQINLATHLQTLTKIYSLYNTEFPYGMWSCMHEGSNNKALKKRTLERMKKKEKKIREKRKNGELISVKNPSHFVKVACFLFFFLYIFLFIFFCFVDFYFRRTFI